LKRAGLAIGTLALGATVAMLGWQRLSGPDTAAEAVKGCPLPARAASAPQPGLVWVPGGRLLMGDSVYREEQPQRTVDVSGFWMDRTEVTNDEFAAFVQATGYVTVAERPVDAARHPGLPAAMQQPGAVVFVMPTDVRGRGDLTQWWRYTPGASWRHPGGPGSHIQGRGAYPVVAVTLLDAQAYARWKGRALPTEAQWEWAARAAQAGVEAGAPSGGLSPPAAANTWQGLFPVVNTADDGFLGVAPVGCYAPNALGLHDLIGNVWELTAERWTPDHRSTPGQAPAPAARPGAAPQVVIKGGSFLCAQNYCMRYRAGARQPQEADLGASHVGFRTVLNAPGP
jgi:formylglycine-generating enzyme required for sulfatase activity